MTAFFGGLAAHEVPAECKTELAAAAPKVRRLALALQRRDGTPINGMLALVVGEVIAVGTRTDMLEQLARDLPPRQIQRLQRLVEEECPTTALRLYALFRNGSAFVRLDMLPLRGGATS